MRKRMMMAIALAPWLIVACGDDDDDSAADAAQELCSSIGGLASTVGEVIRADVDPDATTVGDVQEAVEALEDQVASVQEAEDAVSEAVRDDLQEAFDALQGSIEDISADETLAEAGADIEAARTDFVAAWESTLSELNCAAPTTT
jgi:hypothetical protein